MLENINYSNNIYRIGIVIIGIVLLIMVLRWCQKRFIQHSSIIRAKNKVVPSFIPPPPTLQFFGRSRSETIAINAFANILHEKGYDWQKIIVGYRPNFLKNPKTGRHLEIDAYFPDLKLGIEYNGIQHYNYPNHIHQNRKDFDDTLERDRYKIQLSKENGVRIICIPYHVNTCILCEGVYKYKKNSDQDKWNLLKDFLSKKMNTIPVKT